MDNLPNPKLMAHAQSLNVFCQVISQAASQLSAMTDTSSPEYVSMINLMKHNLPELKVIAERLEVDLA